MNQGSAQQKLVEQLAGLTPPPAHPALVQLVEFLKDRHGSCVASVLFYGSCLRSGDPYEGLVDLYLVVDRYRCANSGWVKAAWNWLLPPNVFYAEFAHEGRMVRCKYAILSLADLEKEPPRTGSTPTCGGVSASRRPLPGVVMPLPEMWLKAAWPAPSSPS